MSEKLYCDDVMEHLRCRKGQLWGGRGLIAVTTLHKTSRVKIRGQQTKIFFSSSGIFPQTSTRKGAEDPDYTVWKCRGPLFCLSPLP